MRPYVFAVAGTCLGVMTGLSMALLFSNSVIEIEHERTQMNIGKPKQELLAAIESSYANLAHEISEVRTWTQHLADSQRNEAEEFKRELYAKLNFATFETKSTAIAEEGIPPQLRVHLNDNMNIRLTLNQLIRRLNVDTYMQVVLDDELAHRYVLVRYDGRMTAEMALQMACRALNASFSVYRHSHSAEKPMLVISR